MRARRLLRDWFGDIVGWKVTGSSVYWIAGEAETKRTNGKNNENKKQQWIDREEPASQVTERKERGIVLLWEEENEESEENEDNENNENKNSKNKNMLAGFG